MMYIRYEREIYSSLSMSVLNDELVLLIPMRGANLIAFAVEVLSWRTRHKWIIALGL